MTLAARGHRWSFVLDEPVRILVADDDPILREFATVHLSTPVASVETAADGEEAWARLVAEPFDLLISDIEMPNLDGFGLVARIRAEPRLAHLPIVMVTGREDIVSIDRAYEAGATAFATKPVNWRQLSHQLRYVLRTSRIEGEVRAERDRAESASTLKSNMMTLMRHEFRTPLSTIIGFADLIRREAHGPTAAAYHECADFIHASGHRLLNTFTQMLHYVQMASGDVELAEDEYDLARLVEEAVGGLRAQAAAAGVLVEVAGVEAGLRLTCDREQTVRMLRHLVENAIVHGARGGLARVDAERSLAGGLNLLVTDHGPGIPADRLSACLEPFAQSEAPLTRATEGLGLGLPIARRIAELHGGALAVEPGAESGLTVRVTLPGSRLARAAAVAA